MIPPIKHAIRLEGSLDHPLRLMPFEDGKGGQKMVVFVVASFADYFSGFLMLIEMMKMWHRYGLVEW